MLNSLVKSRKLISGLLVGRRYRHSAAANSSGLERLHAEVAQAIKVSDNIMVMIGAGVSTASGIPDFRYRSKS